MQGSRCCAIFGEVSADRQDKGSYSAPDQQPTAHRDCNPPRPLLTEPEAARYRKRNPHANPERGDPKRSLDINTAPTAENARDKDNGVRDQQYGDYTQRRHRWMPETLLPMGLCAYLSNRIISSILLI